MNTLEWATFCETPLQFIDEWVARNGSADPERFLSEIRNKFSECPDQLKQIPLLSLSSMNNLKNHSLVRYRCMVQDNSLSMEVSPKRASLRHKTTSELKSVNMIFRDEILGFTDEWNFAQPGQSEYYQKQPHACISVPGQNSWTTHAGSNTSDHLLESLSVVDPAEVKLSSNGLNKVHPQSDQLHALVKTYMGDENLLLNDVIEVIGVFEHGLASEDSHDDFGDVSLDSWPRIHALKIDVLKQAKLYEPAYELFKSGKTLGDVMDVTQLRQKIIESMMPVFFNDRLVSEFVFLHLLSQISSRVAGYPVGFMPLNLCQVPDLNEGRLAGGIKTFLDDFMPMVVNIDMSLNNLNKDSWMFPRMGQAGLCTGLLQLADGTYVIVDETKLTDGKLEGRGVANLTALKDTLMSASVMYEIAPESHMEKSLDASFLILSHGKSMLPSSCAIPLHPEANEPQASILPRDCVDLARLYFGAARFLTVTIPENMEEIISKDFAKAQEAIRASGTRTPDDGTLLTSRINLARLVAKSFGLSEMNQNCWDIAGSLEEQRLQRVAALPQRRESSSSSQPRTDMPQR